MLRRPVRAGQACWFHSCTARRAGPNISADARRAPYPTNNGAAEDDPRNVNYLPELIELAARTDDRRVARSRIGTSQETW